MGGVYEDGECEWSVCEWVECMRMESVSGVGGVFLSVIVYEQSINQWSVEEQEEHRQHRMDRHSGNKRDRQTDRQQECRQHRNRQIKKG